MPYTTIVGFYTKGYEGTRLSTLKSLSSFFKVSINYLCLDEITDPNFKVDSTEYYPTRSPHE